MAPPARPFRRELLATFLLALPLVATNLAQVGLTTADVVLIGRLGRADRPRGTDPR